MNQIIIEMAKFECQICGHVVWIFPRNDEEINALECSECHTTLKAMHNQEQLELNIDKIREEQI